VVDRAALQKAEPTMNTNHLLGAAYSVEGMLDPLKFSLAYAKAAHHQGAVILGRSKVTGFEVKNHQITAVKTKNTVYRAEKVAVMAGAWTSKVTRMAGISVPVHFTHAEALVTERIPPMIFNNVELADFYETIHGKARAVAIGVHPQLNGTLDISEAITTTDKLNKGVSAWGVTSISKELLQLYPFLKKVRVVRTWGRPTSFTPDEEPMIGWVPERDNLFIATSLVITITTVPLLSEWMALMLQGKTPPVSLEEYSPARFIQQPVHA
jgi:glycine/D-amino acid oxidase-like deaminating enzyme